MKKLLKAGDVAEITQLSAVTIYKWAEEGKIPSFRLGNRVRFDYEEVMQWLKEKKRKNKTAGVAGERIISNGRIHGLQRGIAGHTQ